MPLTRNIIALQRGWAIIPAGDADHTNLAATVQAELMQLGYVLDASAFAAACRAPREWLVQFHDEVLGDLRKRMGADHPYPPFYVNFPQQVMDTSTAELFINAMVHYLSGGAWEPPQALYSRRIAFENTDFKPVTLATEDQFKQLFTRLAGINQSLTVQDKEALVWLIDTYGSQLQLPPVVPFKETMCILASLGVDVPVKTPTDVLRIAVHMSGGDISLPSVPKPYRNEIYPNATAWFFEHARKANEQQRSAFKFRKFSRPERRRILTWLEQTGADPAEMQSRCGRWLRLGEVLHVGEHASRFPRSAKAFAALRNQPPKVRTYNAEVDLAFARRWPDGLALLMKRPGELARRLDWLLRKYDRRPVLDGFESVAGAISSKVLFELYNHFAARIDADTPRVVMIKGRGSKMKTLPPLPAMPADLIQGIGNTILRELKGRFAKLPPLGQVWIDPRLREVPIPSGMRSVNTAVKTWVRGTRVPFRADAKVIRAFIHWNDEHGKEDLDLSASFYDEKLVQLAHLSFTNLKLPSFNCCHSGDVRHRVGASAEYVDVDIRHCLAGGVRYVMVQAYNYNARPMHSVKECVFGLMEREHAQANEVFVPRTISQCMPLANESTSVAVCVLDLQAGQYIWTDIESQQIIPMVEVASAQNAGVLRSMIFSRKMSVYELLKLHADVRGSLVADHSAADVVMRWEDFASDYSHVATFM